jgi:hypothetical protein
MTQDDIIEWALEANIGDATIEYYKEELEAFAKLVAAKHDPKIAIADAYRAGVDSGIAAEREACARLSITIPNPYKDCQISAHGYDMGILEYSRAIRARGEA